MVTSASGTDARPVISVVVVVRQDLGARPRGRPGRRFAWVRARGRSAGGAELVALAIGGGPEAAGADGVGRGWGGRPARLAGGAGGGAGGHRPRGWLSGRGERWSRG